AREEPRSAHGRRGPSNRTTNSTTPRKRQQALHSAAPTSGSLVGFFYSTLCSRSQKLNNTCVNLDGEPVDRGLTLARVAVEQTRICGSFHQPLLHCLRVEQIRLLGHHRQCGLNRITSPVRHAGRQ